jgi:uncharacterized CHY-type Zn-finger protein
MTRKCSSCKKEKEEDGFLKPHHKTCAKCIARVNRWEKKHKRVYFIDSK